MSGSLQQNILDGFDAAINDWRKQLRACVHANEQHLNTYWDSHETEKIVDKWSAIYSQKMLLYCWVWDFQVLKLLKVRYVC